eukprot:7115762-Alexandrium_andersonii.AAC.1
MLERCMNDAHFEALPPRGRGRPFQPHGPEDASSAVRAVRTLADTRAALYRQWKGSEEAKAGGAVGVRR